MKIWEICKEENVGKKFEDSDGKEWRVCKHVFDSTYYDLKDKFDIHIAKQYYMSEIAELDFEEVVDWSKLPVDTKIEVRVSEHNEWSKRHFAKFENGFIYAWDNGKTSFTSNTKVSYTAWQQAKLYKEGEE